MTRFLITTVTLLLSAAAAAATYSLVPSPGVMSCGSTVVVASYGRSLTAPTGCSKTSSSTVQSVADFLYQLDQAVGLDTLSHGTDALYLARRHHITVPTTLTVARIDRTSTDAGDLGGELADLAGTLPYGTCDWTGTWTDADYTCVEAVVNGQRETLCTLLGVTDTCMLVAM